MNNVNRFGVMLDMSRNGVMTVPQVKNYIDILQKIVYNICNHSKRSFTNANSRGNVRQ